MVEDFSSGTVRSNAVLAMVDEKRGYRWFGTERAIDVQIIRDGAADGESERYGQWVERIEKPPVVCFGNRDGLWIDHGFKHNTRHLGVSAGDGKENGRAEGFGEERDGLI